MTPAAPAQLPLPNLIRAFGAVALIALLSRGALALRDVLLASRLGTGDDVDALIAAAAIPLFLAQTLGWAMGQAFLPFYSRIRRDRGEAAAQGLLLQVTALGAGCMLAVGMCTWAAAPLLLGLVAGGFPPAKHALTAGLLLPLALLPALAACAALWGAALTVAGRQKLVASVVLLTPLLEVALLAFRPSWGVGGLAWLRLGGNALEVVVLALVLFSLRATGAKWSNLSNLSTVATQYASLVLGASIGSVSVLVDQAMSAPLGAGSVAALSYGCKVGLGLLGLFDIALAAVIYPRLADLAAQRDWTGLRATVRQWATGTFAIVAAGTLLLVAFSEPLVRLLFERGSFGAADTELVARVQALFVLQLPFHAAALVGTRLLSALSRNQDLVLVSIVNALLNVFANLVLRKVLGVSGIALATSCVYVSAACITWVLSSRALDRAERSRS